MKFFGPLIKIHFRDCDLECRDTSPQECRNVELQNTKMSKCETHFS
jgi:hypothetical protein